MNKKKRIWIGVASGIFTIGMVIGLTNYRFERLYTDFRYREQPELTAEKTDDKYIFTLKVNFNYKKVTAHVNYIYIPYIDPDWGLPITESNIIAHNRNKDFKITFKNLTAGNTYTRTYYMTAIEIREKLDLQPEIIVCY